MNNKIVVICLKQQTTNDNVNVICQKYEKKKNKKPQSQLKFIPAVNNQFTCGTNIKGSKYVTMSILVH